MADTLIRRNGSRQFSWKRLVRCGSVAFGACLAFAMGAQDAGAARNGVAVTTPSWAAYVGTPNGPCSGTIVGNGWVLTAAHCLYRTDGSPLPAHSFSVRLGRKSAGSPGVAYRVDSRVVMPGFARLKANDAALLHLAGFGAARWDALPLARSADEVHGAGALDLFGYGDDPLRRSPAGTFADSDGCWSKRLLEARSLCVHATAAAKLSRGDAGAGWLRRVHGAWRLVAVQGWSTAGKRSFAVGTSTLAVTPRGQTLLQWVQATARLPSPAAGAIIREAATGAAWLIDAAGSRSLIPDSGTYQCLVAQGHAVYRGGKGLRSIDLGTIAVRVGVRATCSVAPTALTPVTCWDGSLVLAPQVCPAEPATVRCWDGSFVTPSQVCPPEPPDKRCWDGSTIPGEYPCPPRRWAEMQSPAHPGDAFMDYHDASGPGPAIAAGSTVYVSCRVFAPNSANPGGWWYRIVSAPWNDQYYSPAGEFTDVDSYDGSEVADCVTS